MNIYPRKMFKTIVANLLCNYDYLGTSDTDELAFKEKTTGNFIVLSVDCEYIYCKIIR